MSFFGLIKGLISDTASRSLRVDSSTHTLQVLDHEHHEIHAKKHFFISNAVTLADTAVQEVLITTPDTDEEVHVKFKTQSTSKLDIDFYEGSDRVGANAITPINSNRRTPVTASSLVVHGTVSGGTTDGVLLAPFAIGQVGATPAKGSAGGGSSSSEEIVLARNTKYLLRFTSGDDDNRISSLVTWYEHTPKG